MFTVCTHTNSMFIRFDHNPEHLRRLQAFLVDQLHTDVQQLRERMLDDLVEFLPLFPGLESVHAADGQQTLQARIDRIGIVGTEQLERDVQESGPLLGEIMLEDLLQKRDELGANVGGRRRQCRNQPLSESGLLGVGDGCAQRVVLHRRPTAVDAVLQVDTG